MLLGGLNKMELKEFVQRGYIINAQVSVIETRKELSQKGYTVNVPEVVVETHKVDLENLGENVRENLDEAINTQIDNSQPVSYDIFDPDGELISGYKPTLFNDEEVRAFIAKL